MYPRLSFAATVSGVILQLVGLALHAQGAALATHEGLFALSDPGNFLFFVGLALTVLGVGTMLLTLLLRGAGSTASMNPRAGRSRRVIAASASVLIAIAALALVVGMFVPTDVASTGQVQSTHAHDDADDSSSQHRDEINITWERLREIDRMLDTAKAETEKYRDVDLARADGYRQVMGTLYGTGAHFVNQQHLDDEGGFDAARPEALLYDRADDGSLELVGVAYMLPRQSDDKTPPTYFGPLGVWHEHDFHRPCLTTRTSGHPVTVNSAEADCRAAGNVFIPPKFWMLHVWLFRPGPEGVFSHVNSTIEGPPDVSVAGEVK